MKSPTDLLLSLLEESGRMCDVDTNQDRKTILARVRSEGDSFLTITLPTYLKALYKCLDKGRSDAADWKGFQVRGHMPTFLGGFMDRIFSRYEGHILPKDSSDRDPALWGPALDLGALLSVIQITGLCAKIERPCTPERVDKAFLSFVETEVDLREWERVVDPILLNLFRIAANTAFGDMFQKCERLLREEALIPHHGPGATADRLRGNAKWRPKHWPVQLEEVFPQGRFAYTAWHHYLADLDSGLIPEPGAAQPVKVVAVPKTLKTPRIIAVEPTAMQYMQQALLGVMLESLPASKWSRAIRLDDQSHNQRLALEGSLDGSLATLDLSEASDRVSAVLVRTMLNDYPRLCEAVFAVRTPSAQVPGFEESIPLAKYASMGSAMTFIIESLVFATIVSLVQALSFRERTGIRRIALGDLVIADVPSRAWSLSRSPRPGVSIYGDDIIVPRDLATGVIDTLEALGLKVNRHKTFLDDMFRESCGKEYFAGQDVTHVKMRRDFPTNTDTGTELVEKIVSMVSLRNQLYERGYWRTVGIIDEQIERYIPFPAVEPSSPALGRRSFLPISGERMDLDLQKPLVKAMQVVGRPPASQLDGVYALAKCLIRSEDSQPFEDSKHLLRGGRPASLQLKKRWLPIY